MTRDHDQDETKNGEIEARLERLEKRRSHAHWWRRATLALLVLGVSAPFAVEALDPVPHVFANGEVISAAAMNENFGHLQDAITDVEARLPAGTCAADQIARFDGTSWLCGDDVTLTPAPTQVAGGALHDNLVVDDENQVSLSADPVVTSVGTRVVDFAVTAQWNNSASNGVTEMSVFANAGSCNETFRGRTRIWRHEDIGDSMDLGDALCFCQQYVDRTPEPDADPVYRWVCLYPRSDGS